MTIRTSIGYAVFNKYKTGNEHFDTLLIILIPTLISIVIANLTKILSLISQIPYLFDNRYTIWNINDDKNYSGGYRICWDSHDNSVLREAILLHVGESSRKHKKNEIRFNTIDHTLDKYKNTVLPSQNKWVFVNDYVEFNYSMSTHIEKEASKVTSCIILRTKHGDEHLKEFVQESIKSYRKTYYSNKDTKYMYMMYETDKDTKAIIWKKYELNHKKTFDSLFFPEKQDMIKLLNDFTASTGKYALPIYPKKMGILLHGPPGTGKSSFIKSVASYTNRSIINIPIANLDTNKQFFDILFDNSFPIKNKQTNDNLKFKDMLFVIEDIDAAIDIIKNRAEEVNTQKIDQKIDQKMTNDVKSNNETIKLMEEIMGKQKDKLNLAGILNALDGILESENRLIIITTNHIEKLDPAFIRPGRIDKIIKFDYVKPDTAKNILNMYFDNQLTDDTDLSFFSELKTTPAEIEQKCSEYDKVDDIINFFKTRLAF
jgi:chaperone BCS1